MPEEPSDRIDRIVRDLLKGRRLALGPRDAAERKSIFAAVRLAAAREHYPRMSPAFKRKLAQELGERRSRESWITRRTALLGGLAAAAGALAGVGAARLGELAAQPARTSPVTSHLVIDPKPGRWVDVAALADLPEAAGYRVQAGSVGAYLFRHGMKVTGVSSICSHLPCELDWLSKPGVLNCPCHNVGFQPDGDPADPTYPLPSLPSVQVRVVEGRVQVLGT